MPEHPLGARVHPLLKAPPQIDKKNFIKNESYPTWIQGRSQDKISEGHGCRGRHFRPKSVPSTINKRGDARALGYQGREGDGPPRAPRPLRAPQGCWTVEGVECSKIFSGKAPSAPRKDLGRHLRG